MPLQVAKLEIKDKRLNEKINISGRLKGNRKTLSPSTIP